MAAVGWSIKEEKLAYSLGQGCVKVLKRRRKFVLLVGRPTIAEICYGSGWAGRLIGSIGLSGAGPWSNRIVSV